MTLYETTGKGPAVKVVRGGCSHPEGAGIATIIAPLPAGSGVHTRTPAYTSGIARGFAFGASATAALSFGGGGAAAQVEKTCWRYAKPRVGSAE